MHLLSYYNAQQTQTREFAEDWETRVIFDEEWTSWYDYTEGTCPKGHERIVDD